MARLPRARYTRVFKVYAVSMAKDEGLWVAETARRLSISPKTIANWVKLAQEGPDFNPIEKMWSKVKRVLRGIKARTEEDLFAATGTALDTVTSGDAQGWFDSCGLQHLKVKML